MLCQDRLYTAGTAPASAFSMVQVHLISPSVALLRAQLKVHKEPPAQLHTSYSASLFTLSSDMVLT